MVKRLLYAALAASLLVSCWNRSPIEEGADAVLAQMRADSSWVHELDSLAGIAIGPGAECIDPVWHLFSREGRRFFHNQDWGGVLEIPDGFIPEDDPWQAELSFHGTTAHSPDSLVRISFYAGFSVADEDEARNWIEASLAEDGFTVLAMERSEFRFPDGTLSPVLEVSAGNADGGIWRSRHILRGPDGVEFSVCLQYPAGAEDRIRDILPMINRYPFSPDGRFERGEALTYSRRLKPEDSWMLAHQPAVATLVQVLQMLSNSAMPRRRMFFAA